MLHFTSLCVHTVFMMTACVLCVAPLHVHSCPRLYDQTDQSATDSDSLNKQVLGAKGAYYWEYMFAAPNLLFKYKHGGGCVCVCVAAADARLLGWHMAEWLGLQTVSVFVCASVSV